MIRILFLKSEILFPGSSVNKLTWFVPNNRTAAYRNSRVHTSFPELGWGFIMIIPDINQDGGTGYGSAPSTLFFHPFSLYSIIVRLAFELGHSLSPEDSPTVRLRLVDLTNDENLTEEYLRISPKGQVSYWAG